MTRVAGARRYALLPALYLISASLFVPNVVAQSTPSSGLPEALKGINLADGVCRPEARVDEAPIISPPTKVVQPDLSCAVTPTDAASWLNVSETLFVDTRLPAEYAVFGIPGAVNMPVSDLMVKSYLVRKRIVLFGSGKGEEELYRACTSLKRQGFARVHVLRGGVAQWRVAKLPLIGRVPVAALLSRIDAAELLRESAFDDNVVLVVPNRASMKTRLPSSFALPGANAESIKTLLERRGKELKGAPMASVILVAGSDLDDQEIDLIRQALSPVPILFFTGDSNALVQFATRQDLMLKAYARGPKKPGCGY